MSTHTDTLTWPAARIRQTFLDFFAERGHRVVPSSAVFPLDDPTLLFTNAGMNQFKDVFLGTGTRDYTRAVDTQKCIRASGKHNDLEDVGVDTYHHTFFEMLGNWSFGDYFKEDTIVWAWTLLTEVFGLPKERLWVTVFEGDAADGLGPDTEAERIWLEKTDVDPARVLRLPKGENFWEMGDTGPCGPCSEIHLDRGGPETNPADGSDPVLGITGENERFIELWNLVFMEFQRLDDGSLKELPAKSVDTGMGFERITAVLQGTNSNYHTDLFAPVLERIADLTGKTYEGGDSLSDIAFRVCADHMRALTASLSDGATPSNTGRGYVLRRLVRRAARFGTQELGMQEPWLYQVVPAVAESLGDAFPEMRARLDHVQLIIEEEERSFGRTLGRGIQRFEALAKEVEAGGSKSLPGDQAFELYATSGFPQDLVEQMARERGLSVDLEGWASAETKHRNASKSEGRFKQLLSAEELESVPGETESLFYRDGIDSCRDEDCKVQYVADRGDGEVVVVLDRSPFYAESGGQVGDRGRLQIGASLVQVTDTKKVGGVVAHIGKLVEGPLPLAGAAAVAIVAAERRELIRKNHSATHLLGKALREVLGEHVAQQGSEVDDARLRFDFSNPSGMTPEQIDEVERLVNQAVYFNDPVVVSEEELDAAKQRGVVAAFGEKYGERVRVVDMGGWSTELCGGTHVERTGDIGAFAVTSERAISAGVRRLEGVTGPAAVALFQEQRRLLRDAARTLKAAPEELVSRALQLQKQLKEAKKQKAAGQGADVARVAEELRGKLVERDGISWLVADLEGLGGGDLRAVAEAAKGLAPDLVLCLFGREGKAVPFLTSCQGRALETGYKAGDLAKVIAEHLGGGGGGKPAQAQGKGLDASAVPAAVEALAAL
ncbi:MAG: alanine--tRNA ligase [Planctomycetota bacterium]|nr:alanine--tRNA ligase [Planctomycetota bacterium]